jgi:FkbM family methyltransferase
MNIRTELWKGINACLTRLGYELIAVPPVGAGRAMEDGLARLRRQGLEIATIIDVGASDGRWTKKALEFFPNAGALLVEPLEERRAALEAFKRQYPKVDYAIAAAGDHEGEAALHVADDLVGSGISDAHSASTRKVPLVTLDHLASARHVPPPYLIKLDTHGFELPILAGAKECLKQTRLVVMEAYNFQLTAHGRRFHEMCAHMETVGFRCADLVEPLPRPKDGLLWQMDLLFLPKSDPLFDYPHYR